MGDVADGEDVGVGGAGRKVDDDPARGGQARVGGKLVVASAPPPNADLGDNGTSVALTADGGILVGSLAVASPSGLIGLAKLVGDTLFESGFDPE